jgi:hypothetical protein
VVPPARVRSYYGQPVLKPPTWKTPDVPAYLFLGGLAGAAAPMGLLGELTGRPALARAGRLAAVAGAAGGSGVLIHDLGRPGRFLNMLRTLKPTSPLSVGSWVLASFGALSGAAAVPTITGRLRGPGRLAGIGSAMLGPAVMTYTAVPAWHDAYRHLPFTFAGSALGSGAGVGLIAAPTAQAGPARGMAMAGAVMELVAQRRIDRLGLVAEPYRRGRSGRLMWVGRALTVAGTAGAVAGHRSRLASAVAGVALLAGSVVTRWGVFEAGRASAADPVYTVVPQRERLAQRAAAASQVSAPPSVAGTLG